MTWPPPGPPPSPRAAVLRGHSAWAVNELLRLLLSRPGAWRRLVDPLSPRQRSGLVRALREIDAAAAAWLAAEEAATAGVGNTPTPVGEVGAGWPRGWVEDEIDVREAAQLLGLQPRRVRDLAGAGGIAARRVGGAWRLSRASVLEVAAQRRAG